MIQKSSIYYDTDEMTAKEAFWAACDAAKHQLERKVAYNPHAELPNGKTIVVDCNSALTQIRCAKVP